MICICYLADVQRMEEDSIHEVLQDEKHHLHGDTTTVTTDTHIKEALLPVCSTGFSACKWSAKAKIPVFLLKRLIGLRCLLPEHSDITTEHSRSYWLALQHIVRDRLKGGTSLSG